MEGFKAQYLNIWRLRTPKAERGEAITHSDDWYALTVPPPFTEPDSAAIESWFGEGVTLALAWRVEDGAPVVSTSDHADLASAVEALRESGYKGVVTVGKSLTDDPALRGVRLKGAVARTGAAVSSLGRLLAERTFTHDGSAHLSDQVLAARTMPGADGPRMASQGRADAIKAALWAVESARASTGKPRILMPSS
jgi:hypothetical protein